MEIRKIYAKRMRSLIEKTIHYFLLSLLPHTLHYLLHFPSVFVRKTDGECFSGKISSYEKKISGKFFKVRENFFALSRETSNFTVKIE